MLQIKNYAQKHFQRLQGQPLDECCEGPETQTYESDMTFTDDDHDDDKGRDSVEDDDNNDIYTQEVIKSENDYHDVHATTTEYGMIAPQEIPFVLDVPRKATIPTGDKTIHPVGSVVLVPYEVDVVATRNRIWANHPGSIFYQHLVRRCIQLLMAGCTTPQSQMVDRILNIIYQDRGGIFLLEKQGTLFVMRPSAARNKVTLALTRGRKVSELGSQPKRKSRLLMQPMNVLSMTSKYQNENEKKVGKSSLYRAKEGALALPEYTLVLISYMCNQMDPQDALNALDNPLVTSEDNFQRLTRLHLRHRYIAAMSVAINPLAFSRKLMHIWGGSIVQIDPTDKTLCEVIFETKSPVGTSP